MRRVVTVPRKSAPRLRVLSVSAMVAEAPIAPLPAPGENALVDHLVRAADDGAAGRDELARRPSPGWVGPLWVEGKPQPKGSTRAFMVRGRPVITSDNSALAPWARAIALAFRMASGPSEAPERLTQVRMRFYVERPKQHHVAGDRRRELKADVPLYPGRKPDIDKLARGVLDALAGKAYYDDAAVVGIDASKDFCIGHPPGVLLWWRYLPGPIWRKTDSGTP